MMQWQAVLYIYIYMCAVLPASFVDIFQPSSILISKGGSASSRRWNKYVQLILFRIRASKQRWSQLVTKWWKAIGISSIGWPNTELKQRHHTSKIRRRLSQHHGFYMVLCGFIMFYSVPNLSKCIVHACQFLRDHPSTTSTNCIMDDASFLSRMLMFNKTRKKGQ